jgi:hypothetical protein
LATGRFIAWQFRATEGVAPGGGAARIGIPQLVGFVVPGRPPRRQWARPSSIQAAGRREQRPGVSIGDFGEKQRLLLHDLLRSSTSSQGYHKLTGAIRADDVLYELEREQLFGAAHYYTSVFGAPEDANWAWMLTGHHMSAMFTIAGDRTAFTPMFTGSQPLQIPSGVYAGWQVLPQDALRASELLSALSAEQQHLTRACGQAEDDGRAGEASSRMLA